MPPVSLAASIAGSRQEHLMALASSSAAAAQAAAMSSAASAMQSQQEKSGMTNVIFSFCFYYYFFTRILLYNLEYFLFIFICFIHSFHSNINVEVYLYSTQSHLRNSSEIV